MPETMHALAAMVALGYLAMADGPACPPSARLYGEPALVTGVATLLKERGLETEASHCPSIAVTLDRRHAQLLVTIDIGDGTTVVRIVSDARTAVTLIESWARKDVEGPLLAAHDHLPEQAEQAMDHRSDEQGWSSGAAFDVPATDASATVSATSESAGNGRRGVQVFAVAENTVASDGTRWLGAHVGACVMLGPVCAAARIRFATVFGGTEHWRGNLDRRGTEMLLGADLPLRVGRATLYPGLAAGIGWTHTNDDNSPGTGETGGLRAEVHATLSYPFSRRLAFDVTLSADLAQATHVETASTIPLPDEARIMGRFGAGVRFGGL